LKQEFADEQLPQMTLIDNEARVDKGPLQNTTGDKEPQTEAAVVENVPEMQKPEPATEKEPQKEAGATKTTPEAGIDKVPSKEDVSEKESSSEAVRVEQDSGNEDIPQEAKSASAEDSGARWSRAAGSFAAEEPEKITSL
jgi:hypothetical protein